MGEMQWIKKVAGTEMVVEGRLGVLGVSEVEMRGMREMRLLGGEKRGWRSSGSSELLFFLVEIETRGGI